MGSHVVCAWWAPNAPAVVRVGLRPTGPGRGPPPACRRAVPPVRPLRKTGQCRLDAIAVPWGLYVSAYGAEPQGPAG